MLAENLSNPFGCRKTLMSSCRETLDLPELYRELDSLFARHSFVKETIYRTDAGPIDAWSRFVSAASPTVYLSSGIHGDEPAGPLAIAAFLAREKLAEVNWLVCPVLNPTGLAAGSRVNAEGLDLNRDYLQRVTPEVSCHAAWIERNTRPDLFLSLHEDWEAEGFYFYEISLSAAVPQRARMLLQAVSRGLVIDPNPLIDGHDVREPGWIHHEARSDFPDSWPEAIFMAHIGCPLSFTFETPSCAAPLQQRINAHLAAIDAALDSLETGDVGIRK
jgi:predicted deacylase